MVPTLFEMVLLQIKGLIEFDLLNIEKLIQLIKPEFSLSSWSRGIETEKADKDQDVSMFGE